MSTDVLATAHPQRGHTATTEAAVLETRRTFAPGRLSATYLAAAYVGGHGKWVWHELSSVHQPAVTQ